MLSHYFKFFAAMTIFLTFSSASFALECSQEWINGQCELVQLIEAPNSYTVISVKSIECQTYADGIECWAQVHYADTVGYGESSATEATCKEHFLYKPGTKVFESEELYCH